MSELAFEGQREGEQVKMVFRRHILTAKRGFGWLILMMMLGLVPMLAWVGDVRMFWIFGGFVIVGLLGLGYTYMLWYFSFYIVTDERIRQVSQKGLFKKTVVDLNLNRVQSISYNIPGVLGGMFGYGTILIQTGVGDLVISKVAKPEKVYNKLQNLAGRAEPVQDKE